MTLFLHNPQTKMYEPHVMSLFILRNTRTIAWILLAVVCMCVTELRHNYGEPVCTHQQTINLKGHYCSLGDKYSSSLVKDRTNCNILHNPSKITSCQSMGYTNQDTKSRHPVTDDRISGLHNESSTNRRMADTAHMIWSNNRTLEVSQVIPYTIDIPRRTNFEKHLEHSNWHTTNKMICGDQMISACVHVIPFIILIYCIFMHLFIYCYRIFDTQYWCETLLDVDHLDEERLAHQCMASGSTHLPSDPVASLSDVLRLTPVDTSTCALDLERHPSCTGEVTWLGYCRSLQMQLSTFVKTLLRDTGCIARLFFLLIYYQTIVIFHYKRDSNMKQGTMNYSLYEKLYVCDCARFSLLIMICILTNPRLLLVTIWGRYIQNIYSRDHGLCLCKILREVLPTCILIPIVASRCHHLLIWFRKVGKSTYTVPLLIISLDYCKVEFVSPRNIPEPLHVLQRY